MTTTEFWWEFDSKIAQHKAIKKGPAGFSVSEWEAARKAHREKMKNVASRPAH